MGLDVKAFTGAAFADALCGMSESIQRQPSPFPHLGQTAGGLFLKKNICNTPFKKVMGKPALLYMILFSET